jgi:hypothetical protein
MRPHSLLKEKSDLQGPFIKGLDRRPHELAAGGAGIVLFGIEEIVKRPMQDFLLAGQPARFSVPRASCI